MLSSSSVSHQMLMIIRQLSGLWAWQAISFNKQLLAATNLPQQPGQPLCQVSPASCVEVKALWNGYDLYRCLVGYILLNSVAVFSMKTFHACLTVNLGQSPHCALFQHYLRTGACKYGSGCKYHHPLERLDSPVPLNPLGYPLRPVRLPLADSVSSFLPRRSLSVGLCRSLWFPKTDAGEGGALCSLARPVTPVPASCRPQRSL